MAPQTLTYQAEVDQITDNLLPEVLWLVKEPDTSNIDNWWGNVFPVLLVLVRATMPHVYDAAVRYVNSLARVNDTTLNIPGFEFPDFEMLRTAFRVTGPVAFKTSIGVGRNVEEAVRNMQAQLAGATTKRVLDVGRDLIHDTSLLNEQIVGWRRVTDSNPCFFCAMLASRGAVYRSRETALFSNGDKYHDSCRCGTEPMFREEEEPRSVQELYSFWLEATAGKSGKEAMRAFRRAWASSEKPQGVFGV